MKIQKSARWTLWVNRSLALLVVVLLPVLPWILELFNGLRPLSEASCLALTLAYAACVPVILYAARRMDQLLKNILSRQVFVNGNVRCIRHVRWCCAGISLICLPASFFYPSLFFLVLIMAFLTLVVSVITEVMAAAVELREENDLTV